MTQRVLRWLVPFFLALAFALGALYLVLGKGFEILAYAATGSAFVTFLLLVWTSYRPEHIPPGSADGAGMAEGALEEVPSQPPDGAGRALRVTRYGCIVWLLVFDLCVVYSRVAGECPCFAVALVLFLFLALVLRPWLQYLFPEPPPQEHHSAGAQHEPESEDGEGPANPHAPDASQPDQSEGGTGWE